MNENLQIQVGLFRVTLGKRADPNTQKPWTSREWKSEREQERLRFPLADDRQYVHSRMPPQFVFERRWRDYTRGVTLKKELARRPVRQASPACR